jgi:hypothetical protein
MFKNFDFELNFDDFAFRYLKYRTVF